MNNLILFILLFFIVVIIFPLGFKVKCNYSFIDNLGSFSFTFLKIKIKVFLFTIKDNGIFLIEKKGKKHIEISLTKQKFIYVKELTNQLKEKVKIKRVVFHSKVGLNTAMQSAIANSFVNNIVAILFSILKCKKPYSKLKIESSTVYNEKAFDFNINMKFSISIFDLLYCLFLALVNTRKRRGYERV